ncbi:MAG: PAS domain-containing protein, partial [Microcoleus sp. SIO2G3]|nr:PAS domain-containing protein [Microcoleus sp. SIO2G3]
MPEYDILFQDVFEIIATGIFVVEVEAPGDEGLESATFRFLATNPAYTKLLSLPVATLTGLSPYECFPHNIAQQLCVNYRRCLNTRQPITYEESFEFETHRCTLLTTLSPKLEPDGRILRIIGSSQDISERKQKEEKQKQAEADLLKDKELLFTLIENVPIGIISTNEQGEILFVNPAFEKICGYFATELVGQVPPYPYWDLADLEVINNEFNLAMSGEKE